mmetsp:Transcript_9272/g.20305  ORF Transcript_9272/g.20305 Transcript_9272/m.20305 type:complete len:218 (+) Transcript_9272:69-722(+)
MTSSARTSTVIINSLWSGWPCALRHGSACRSRRSAVNGRNVQEQSCNVRCVQGAIRSVLPKDVVSKVFGLSIIGIEVVDQVLDVNGVAGGGNVCRRKVRRLHRFVHAHLVEHKLPADFIIQFVQVSGIRDPLHIVLHLLASSDVLVELLRVCYLTDGIVELAIDVRQLLDPLNTVRSKTSHFLALACRQLRRLLQKVLGGQLLVEFRLVDLGPRHEL